MFLNSTGYYVPEKRIKNDYFANLHDKTEDWFFQRTGILSRARAAEEETLERMCIEAVKNALPSLPYNIKEVDLIVFASYTPSDTVGTVAHIIQREFKIDKAKAFYISSACSSAINGMEIIKSFFSTKIASKALLIAADKNSTYSNDEDAQSGHLWGDAATAFFFSTEPMGKKEAKLLDISTQGLGHVSLGPKAVTLQPFRGIQMPYGKDVFMQACTYIVQSTNDIISKNNLSISDLSYFISHQANLRIVNYAGNALGLPDEKVLNNLQELGNTGCGSALLVYAQNKNRFNAGDIICLSVFGGGYSSGTCLLAIQE
jgi:3-oxoacyl-[acyl-carrier-protein] synthase-3